MQFNLPEELKKKLVISITSEVNIGRAVDRQVESPWEGGRLITIPVYEPGISATTKAFAYSLTTITSVGSILRYAI
jgi:hypothetical protein